MTAFVHPELRARACVLWVCLACAQACGDASPRAHEPQVASTKPTRIERSRSAEVDDGLTAIDGTELLGRMRASGDKATLVSIWASWCGSCKKELPMIASMAPALRAEGVGLMFISADNPKDRAKAAAMRSSLVPTQPGFIVRGELAPFKRLVNPDWKGSLPSTFLFDSQGGLRYFWPGPVFDYEIEPIVSMFLAGQPLVGPQMIERGPPG